MGDHSVNAYFHKIESIVTRLNDLESPMNDDDVVTYAMHGLSDKFAHVAGIIAHRVLFHDLETMHSMVTTEEMRLNTKSQNSNSNTTSSALTILIVETNSNHGQDSRSSVITVLPHVNLSLKFVVTLAEHFANGVTLVSSSMMLIVQYRTPLLMVRSTMLELNHPMLTPLVHVYNNTSGIGNSPSVFSIIGQLDISNY
ncbi:hypothetical protein Tco_1253701 [Tanacetum coccineum]